MKALLGILGLGAVAAIAFAHAKNRQLGSTDISTPDQLLVTGTGAQVVLEPVQDGANGDRFLTSIASASPYRGIATPLLPVGSRFSRLS